MQKPTLHPKAPYDGFEPRTICGTCRRPQVVCYCRFVHPVATRTRVLILQHPRERDVPINTARIAQLCLPEAKIQVGVQFPALPELSDPDRPAVLLYPAKDATDILANPPTGPVTLVVVDGTWAHARSIVARNPHLAALPRYAFQAPTPSDYRIRREPHEAYMSTIEALVEVLGALEGDSARFRPMLEPFRAMVDMQIAYIKSHANSRQHGGKKKARLGIVAPHEFRTPYLMRERKAHLVCVTAEANAWPYGAKEHGKHELVQWCATRISTGATFDACIAPRRPLCPSTPAHMEISVHEVASGLTLSEFFERWRAFQCDTDILCFWGPYARSLYLDAAEGAPPEAGLVAMAPSPHPQPGGNDIGEPAKLDLRQICRTKLGHGGTMDATCDVLRAPPLSKHARGRAGARLATLVAIARALTGT
jgi:DTW domain-containing protein